MVTSTRLVPDLQFYINKFITESTLNKDFVKIPTQLNVSLLHDNKSFIRLLFDDDWPEFYLNYKYLFRLVDRQYYPNQISRRLNLYAQSAQYYKCDLDNDECHINLFSLQDNDLMMLDRLLSFRIKNDFDLSEIEYDELNTPLSKLIYIYLDFKINESFEKYNNDILISDFATWDDGSFGSRVFSDEGERSWSTLEEQAYRGIKTLCYFYEMYIINDFFIHISNRSIRGES
jgi:hypothetical protein